MNLNKNISSYIYMLIIGIVLYVGTTFYFIYCFNTQQQQIIQQINKSDSNFSELIKKELELHLNKIEHEYTNITIWAAVLTIIFLMFSFYSIFKVEEAKFKVEEAKQEIESIRDNTKQEIAFIIAETNDTLKKENIINIREECNNIR